MVRSGPISYQNIIFLMHSTAILRPLAGQGVLVMPQAFPVPPEVILQEEIQLDRRLPQVSSASLASDPGDGDPGDPGDPAGSLTSPTPLPIA